MFRLLYKFYLIFQNEDQFLQAQCSAMSTYKIPIIPLKFIYSEKATKLCKIFPLLLTVCTEVKSKGKFSQIIVAFSEYTVLHMFRQVLFWAGYQGNHQNFEKFCGLLRIYEHPMNFIEQSQFCFLQKRNLICEKVHFSPRISNRQTGWNKC